MNHSHMRLLTRGKDSTFDPTDYEFVGIFREIGWKAGAWRDVGWWQLRLATMG